MMQIEIHLSLATDAVIGKIIYPFNALGVTGKLDPRRCVWRSAVADLKAELNGCNAPEYVAEVVDSPLNGVRQLVMTDRNQHTERLPAGAVVEVEVDIPRWVVGGEVPACTMTTSHLLAPPCCPKESSCAITRIGDMGLVDTSGQRWHLLDTYPIFAQAFCNLLSVAADPAKMPFKFVPDHEVQYQMQPTLETATVTIGGTIGTITPTIDMAKLVVTRGNRELFHNENVRVVVDLFDDADRVLTDRSPRVFQWVIALQLWSFLPISFYAALQIAQALPGLQCPEVLATIRKAVKALRTSGLTGLEKIRTHPNVLRISTYNQYLGI